MQWGKAAFQSDVERAGEAVVPQLRRGTLTRISKLAMRRRTFLHAAGAATLLARRVPAAGKQYFVYWGTYTTSLARFANGQSKGIYVSRLDSETGKLSTPELAAETKSPSYLAVHPSGLFLYAVNELGADDSETATGYMTSFSIDS